jgi:hypothetical protein
VHGDAVSVGVAVTAQSITPTGQVALMTNSTTSLLAGAVAITAAYCGDQNSAGATAAITVTITAP